MLASFPGVRLCIRVFSLHSACLAEAVAVILYERISSAKCMRCETQEPVVMMRLRQKQPPAPGYQLNVQKTGGARKGQQFKRRVEHVIARQQKSSKPAIPLVRFREMISSTMETLGKKELSVSTEAATALRAAAEDVTINILNVFQQSAEAHGKVEVTAAHVRSARAGSGLVKSGRKVLQQHVRESRSD